MGRFFTINRDMYLKNRCKHVKIKPEVDILWDCIIPGNRSEIDDWGGIKAIKLDILLVSVRII